MGRDDLAALNRAYDALPWPEAFAARYTLLECLAERNGVETFLAQDRSGQLCVAKLYDKTVWSPQQGSRLLAELDHEGLPRQLASFENEAYFATVREYAEGLPLDRYAAEHPCGEEELIGIGARLCEILAYLHGQPEPVVHRDIKPSNVIRRPDGSLVLIDFDIARRHHASEENDTCVFGTRSYAPPEQYGFAQTDARTDLYALGVLLRSLLPDKAAVSERLARVLRRCTAFSPDDRYPDALRLKKALLTAAPASRRRRGAFLLLALLLLAALSGLALRQHAKAGAPAFDADIVPAYVSDEARIADAVAYMREKYDTELFSASDDLATVGLLRQCLIECYGLDRDYVYGINTEMPQESDAFFLPWGWDDGQDLDRDPAFYAALKVHDPSLVADWSSLRDDNGFYPGVRVAMAFAAEHGLLEGANQPGDISVGELALLFANVDRYFEAAR